jgi:putative hydrolase of the HAD superfamily
MTVKAVFFDAGGTLIRPHPSVGEVYGDVAAALGHPVDPASFDALLPAVWTDYQQRARQEPLPLPTSDADDRAMWRIVTRRIFDGIPPLRTMDFDRWFDGIYGAFSSSTCWRVYDEVHDVIVACRRRGCRCGIVSNWSTALMPILRDHGLDARMDFILVSAQEGCMKPDPEFYRRALDRAAVAPSEALHVGDTYRDDASGAAAVGIRGIHLDRHGRDVPGNGLPVVADLTGILDYL